MLYYVSSVKLKLQYPPLYVAYPGYLTHLPCRGEGSLRGRRSKEKEKGIRARDPGGQGEGNSIIRALPGGVDIRGIARE